MITVKCLVYKKLIVQGERLASKLRHSLNADFPMAAAPVHLFLGISKHVCEGPHIGLGNPVYSDTFSCCQNTMITVAGYSQQQ